MKDLVSRPIMADYQAYIESVCLERGWNKRTDLEKMLFLTEEVGEVAKAIRKEHGIYGYKKPTNTDHLAEELVDVFNYLLDLANMYQIDLEKAFRTKWETNKNREWK
ncbi:MAG: MazG nucleotide pyrophosphohydrolase domain-containing protein [Candidatus Saccharimonadales bacterium]